MTDVGRDLSLRSTETESDHDRLLADYAEEIRAAESQFPVPTTVPAEVEASRGQVVAAATARMVNEPMGVLTQGLNPSRFDSWMPGLRRKAYRYFPSTTDLIHQVLADAVDPSPSKATDQLMRALEEAAESLAAPLEVVKTLSSAYVDQLISDAAFRLQVTAWLVMADSPSLQEDLEALHAALIDHAAEALAAVIGSYGLAMRPPLDWHDLGRMILASVQGTVLQAEILEDDYDPSVLANAVMGLVMGLTYRPETGDDTMDDAYLRHVSV